MGQGGLHVQGQGGLDLLHGGEHRDEEHGNGRHKQVYITIIIIIVFMVIIIVFFIVIIISTEMSDSSTRGSPMQSSSPPAACLDHTYYSIQVVGNKSQEFFLLNF